MIRIKFIPIILAIMLSACMPTDEVKPDLGTVIKLSASDYSIKQDNEKTNTYIVEFLTQMATPIWSYGDDVKTDRTSSFYFPKKGEYNIILKAYNKAGISDSILIPVSIAVSDPMAFDIEGGNMEESDFWTNTNLSSTSPKPIGVWNYTADKPKDGKGGCLYVSGTTTSGTLHYAIFQKVSLINGASYKFDGAFKDVTAGDLDRFWCEVYIGTTAPVEGSDYGNGVLKIKQFNSWDPTSIPAHKDMKFSATGGGTGIFECKESKDYYLVIKMGTTTWDGKAVPFNVMLDELSFKRI